MSHARVLNPRVAMWLPAAVLLTIGVLAATGFGTVTSSKAATSNTTVTATVGPELHIGGTCAGASFSGATMAAAAGSNPYNLDGGVAGNSCTLTFGTNNNGTGALLRVRNSRPGNQNTFCTAALVTSPCGATSFTETAFTGSASLADGAFAIEADIVTTCVAPTWTVNNYYGLRDSTSAAVAQGDLVCDQTNTTDANYTLKFWADPSATQVSGTYSGRAEFTVMAS